MADYIEFDPADPTVANRVVEYRQSVNTPDIPATNTVINPTITVTLAQKYWKWNGSTAVVDMSAGEIAAIDAADAAAALAAGRAEAISRTDLDITTRELVEALLFEINKINTRVQELQDAMVAVKATSGGSDNIRAAIPAASPTSNAAPASFLNIQPKTRGQVLQTMVDDINAGTADP